MIVQEIFKAISYLFIAAIAYSAYWTVSRAKGNMLEVLSKGFLWCVGIAFFASVILGKPTCIDSETDNRGTICNEYTNDGYEPTTEQRAAQVAYYMTLLYIPVVLGAFNKPMKIEDKHTSKNE